MDSSIIRQRKKMSTQNWSFCGFYTTFWSFCVFSLIISSIFGDCEFEPLRADFPQLNTTSANEHVSEAERCIRTIKERTRSTYAILPFTYIPRLVIIHLVKNSVLWLNALPAKDGVSNNHSPRYLLTGAELNYENHVQIEFGKYVQTHEEHDNSRYQ